MTCFHLVLKIYELILSVTNLELSFFCLSFKIESFVSIVGVGERIRTERISWKR